MIGVTKWIRQLFDQESSSVISPYLASRGQSFHKDIQVPRLSSSIEREIVDLRLRQID